MTNCPKFPESEEELPFRVQRKMVDWMDPGQLAATGVRAVLSTTFGAYADKRELQAALSHGSFVAQTRQEDDSRATIAPLVTPDADFSETAGDLWIDFAADLGDAFDATYTIARLLAAERLKIAGETLPRGNVLVLGGDQVYPTATRIEYRDKFEGPYQAALPCVLDEAKAPALFAVPGNHDWYDGLTSFLRLFCHGRWIGGWSTRQHRSYFAVKLPRKWWLWGIDIQLAADVDLPQIEFFEAIADNDPEFAGSKVILCTGTPSWTKEIRKRTVRERLEDEEGYANLGFFEKRVIVKRGAEPVLTLTGDLHHYARYAGVHPETKQVRHKITAGGGGAYLYGTHGLPAQIYLDDSLKDTDPPVTYTRQPALFPTAEKSKALTWGALLFPWKGRKLAFMLGIVYLLNAWFVQSGSKKYSQSLLGEIALYPVSLQGLFGTFGAALHALAHSPATVAFWAVIVAGFCAFAGKGARSLGLIHGGAHLSANLLLAWIFARLNYHWLYRRFAHPGMRASDVAENVIDSILQTGVFGVEMLVIGSLIAGCIFGVYLLIGGLLPPNYPHLNEAFSSQAIADYKNFLRVRIAPSGNVTVYALGVTKVATWKLRDKNKPPVPQDHEPWFVTADGKPVEERVHLVEKVSLGGT